MNKEIILIIGASSSIGCELIRQLSNKDTIILAHYYSQEKKDVISRIQLEVEGSLVPLHANLSNEFEIDSMIDVIKSSYDFPGKIVFLAAPSLVLTRFKDIRLEDFKYQMEVQVYATCKILNSFLPKMATARRGKIVFMISSYTIGIPPVAMAHYVTTKYALLGLMKSLSSEFSGKQICINAVSPSMIETEFLSQIPEKIIEITADKHPQKRNGLPSDVVPVIKFLLSDEACYITGVNMPITGGA